MHQVAIYIITDTLLPVRAEFKAFVTFASVRAFSIDTVAILAQISVGSAFVNVPTVVRHAYLSVTFWTDAHERSNQVFASKFAVVGRRSALVHVLAVTTICCQSVTVRTNTAERSWDVVASESTLVAHFLAFVNIFADLHGSWSESFSTITFESSFDVSTGAVAANVGHGAFIVICNELNIKVYKFAI